MKLSGHYALDQTVERLMFFGFVIMPNHMHLIWRIKELNGKETPQGSLLKFTAHRFKKMLIEDGG